MTNNIKGLGERQKPRKGDYYNKSGILICGICGKPREWHGDFLPQLKNTWACAVCNCDLNRTQQAAQEAEKKARIRIAKMRRGTAFRFNEELVGITFAKDDEADPAISKAVRRYVNNFEKALESGKNLFLFGDVGTGKTFMAAAVLNAAIDQGYKCYFTSFFREIEALKTARDKIEYLQTLKDYDFVVFDDFGTERETDFNIEQIYQIINARYCAKRPSIITTNMDNSEFLTEQMNKKRIFSRIFENFEPIMFDGKDRRMAMFKKAM